MAVARTRKATALKAPMTKAQLLQELTEATGLHKRDVASVLDELGVIVERHIRKRATGTFTLPGLLKIERVRKPAQEGADDDLAAHRRGDRGGGEAGVHGGPGAAARGSEEDGAVGPGGGLE